MISDGLTMTVLTHPLQTVLMGIVAVEWARSALPSVVNTPMRYLRLKGDLTSAPSETVATLAEQTASDEASGIGRRVRIEVPGHRAQSKSLRTLSDGDAEALMKTMLGELRATALARSGVDGGELSVGQVRIIVTPASGIPGTARAQ